MAALPVRVYLLLVSVVVKDGALVVSVLMSSFVGVPPAARVILPVMAVVAALAVAVTLFTPSVTVALAVWLRPSFKRSQVAVLVVLAASAVPPDGVTTVLKVGAFVVRVVVSFLVGRSLARVIARVAAIVVVMGVQATVLLQPPPALEPFRTAVVSV